MSGRGVIPYAAAFAVLVVCNAAGGFAASLLRLPVPGTVIGILILLAGFGVAGRIPEPVRRLAVFLLRHLNLFYIPAGVGVMAYAGLVRQDLIPIVAALVGGTFAALVAGAFAFQWTAKLTGNVGERP